MLLVAGGCLSLYGLNSEGADLEMFNNLMTEFTSASDLHYHPLRLINNLNKKASVYLTKTNFLMIINSWFEPSWLPVCERIHDFLTRTASVSHSRVTFQCPGQKSSSIKLRKYSFQSKTQKKKGMCGKRLRGSKKKMRCQQGSNPKTHTKKEKQQRSSVVNVNDRKNLQKLPVASSVFWCTTALWGNNSIWRRAFLTGEKAILYNPCIRCFVLPVKSPALLLSWM